MKGWRSLLPALNPAKEQRTPALAENDGQGLSPNVVPLSWQPAQASNPDGPHFLACPCEGWTEDAALLTPNEQPGYGHPVPVSARFLDRSLASEATGRVPPHSSSDSHPNRSSCGHRCNPPQSKFSRTLCCPSGTSKAGGLAEGAAKWILR